MSGKHWWRAYDGCVDDPKLRMLSDETFRAWFHLCCIASANDGLLPSIDVVAFKLRCDVEQAKKYIRELSAKNLIDLEETEQKMHDWGEWQYKSDVSTPRVKRFRERQRNVSETPPDNRVQITDSERKKEDIRAVAVATRPDEFEEFWKSYPKREGANPKAPARKSFLKAVRTGVDPPEVIAAAKRYADECRRLGIFATSKVAQAVTWLNQSRWDDYAATAPPAENDKDRRDLADLKLLIFEGKTNGGKSNDEETGRGIAGLGVGRLGEPSQLQLAGGSSLQKKA